MKKLTAFVLALALVLTSVAAFATDEVPAFISKTAQDRVVIEAEGVTAVPAENPVAAQMAAELAVLPPEEKMNVFPEEVKEVVIEALADIPEVENISELEPVDTYKLELTEIQPGAKLKLEGVYGDEINVIGYIVEFLPEERAIKPIFVPLGEEFVIPDGILELVVYAIARHP